MTAAASRLRLAERLIEERRADEAAALLRDLPGAGDAATTVGLAALALAQGHLAEAARGARAALAMGPLPARLLVSAAAALAQTDPEAADAALAGAIAADPDVELRLTRARLAETRGRTDLAAENWRRALDLADRSLEARLGLIRSLRVEGRLAEAERLAKLLLADQPKDPRPALELARIAHEAGDPVEAESRWHAALLLHPGQDQSVLGLARALNGQHRFTEARALLEALAVRDPDRHEPFAALVRTLLTEGDLVGAAARAATLAARPSGNHSSRLLTGEVHEATGDFTGAQEAYRAVLSVAPQDLPARLALARLAGRQGDLETAADLFAAILGEHPGQLDALIGLSGTLAELGSAEEADATAVEAIRRAPNQPRTHLARSRAAETAGHPDAARLALLEGRSALPWRAEPLLELARLALRQGQQEAIAERGAALLACHPRHLDSRLVAFDCAVAGAHLEQARAIMAPLAEELPRHREVERRLARLAWHDGAIEPARARWRRITRHDIRIHGGPDPIERLDRHPLPPADGEIRVFMLVRNERVRLPWLLDYYRALGADRFLLLDNGSDDGTGEWLLAQRQDIHVFRTEASFAAAGAGMRWINRLLDEHGCGAWCLTIDADEALVYPGAERVRLPELAAYLDGTGAESMAAPMLDLYADAPLDSVRYQPGQSLIEAFPWFDGSGYVRRDSNDFPYFRLHGGARARLFHDHAGAGPVLQKVPLIRWRKDIKYTSSKHTAFPCRLADVSGVLLHFKYLPQFADQVRAEVRRGQHYLGAREYRTYQRRLDEGTPLSPAGPESRRYRDSRQLVELGLMATSPAYERHVDRAG
ncbi:MAG: tetratricopeptide repeat protein [Geminicoccaceae bacterium]